MNTPAHAIINLALLGRKKPAGAQLAILAGSLTPDAPMFWFYFVEKFVRATPERVIWNEAYFRQSWQNFIDVFNSAPLIALGLVFSLWRGLKVTTLFFASMLVHVVLDFPVHHDDAHRHFYPLSNWRFESPLSYWDRAHYGHIVSIVEIAVVIVCCVVVFRSAHHLVAKASSLIIAAIYAAFLVFAVMVWGAL